MFCLKTQCFNQWPKATNHFRKVPQKNELLASGVHPETMKHIFLESCLLKIAKLQDLP